MEPLSPIPVSGGPSSGCGEGGGVRGLPTCAGPCTTDAEQKQASGKVLSTREGSGKRTLSPPENNYGRGVGPRLEGGGCQRGQQWRRANPKSREVLPSYASVRSLGARGREGRRGAGSRRSHAGSPSKSWAANTALACAAASAVSWLLSGWGAGINLSPPRSVQSQAPSHAGAGRAESGGAEGRRGRRWDSASSGAPLPRAVRGPRASRALRSLRRRRREGSRRRRGAARRRLLQAQVNGVT